MTKAFVSYHHKNDQWYKEHLSYLANTYGSFTDISVRVGDIDENLDNQTIRRIIRDEYLKDSEVTILLCGTETRFRKHVDWELKSSMINGSINKRSGIVIIDLPTTTSNSWHCSLPGEKEKVYPDYTGNWLSIEKKEEYKKRYPEMPDRIIDNLLKPSVRISIVPWSRVESNPEILKFLVDSTAQTASTNDYDLSLPMRMRDHNPSPGILGL